MAFMQDPAIRPFHPDDAPWLVERHGTLYARENGFDESFAPLVAEILAAFIADHDPRTESGWIAHDGARRLGSGHTAPTAAPAARVVPDTRDLVISHDPRHDPM